MKFRVWASAALLLAALALPARGEDQKIFHLKNGRKIEGELVDQTATSYVIKTSGGKTTIAKDMVAKIEDPPVHKKFLEPDPPKEPPKDEGTPKPDETPTPTTPSKGQPTPTYSAGPLASSSEVDSVRKALAALPTVTVENPAETTAARQKAIDNLVKSAPLGALVAIVSEPTSAANPTVPAERQTALEILSKLDNPKLAPLIAQAVSLVDLEKGAPNQLLSLIRTTGGDDAGTIQAAFLDKIGEVLSKKQSPDVLLPTFERIAKRPALTRMYEWMMKGAVSPTTAKALGACANRIAFSDTDPDAALTPLTAMIDEGKLPQDLWRLTAAAEVLKVSHGEATGKLVRIANALDQLPRTPKNHADHVTALTAVYGAIAFIGNTEGVDAILQAYDRARDAESRSIILEASRAYGQSGQPIPVELLEGLLQRMQDSSIAEEDAQAIGTLMGALTFKRFGTDVNAWKNYIATLKR